MGCCCDHSPNAELLARIDALTRTVAELAAGRNQAPRPVVDVIADDAEPLTLSALAKRWGASVACSIRPAVQRGEIRTVPWGKRVRVPADEVRRLEREGFSLCQRRRQRGRPVKLAKALPNHDAEMASFKAKSLDEVIAAGRARAARR